MSPPSHFTRRSFCAAAAATASLALPRHANADDDRFALRYLCAAAMYGKMPLADVIPQVPRTGTDRIDLWPLPHGDHREQLDAIGPDAFAKLLADHRVALGGITCYKYGPFGVGPQMQLAHKLGATDAVFVTGASGPKDATGDALKRAVAAFVEKLKPHHDAAAKLGYLIAIENHSNSMIQSPDSMRYLADGIADLPHLGIAFAPHHLPQVAADQAALITRLGPAVGFFYAQQHGKGASAPQPRADEHLQMPGKGPLDFGPLLAALRKINFAGYTEILMHPFPRGTPIADTADAVTAAINESRAYLDRRLEETAL